MSPRILSDAQAAFTADSLISPESGLKGDDLEDESQTSLCPPSLVQLLSQIICDSHNTLFFTHHPTSL